MGYTMEWGADITPGHRWTRPCTEVPRTTHQMRGVKESHGETWLGMKEGEASSTVGAKQRAWLMSSGPVR